MARVHKAELGWRKAQMQVGKARGVGCMARAHNAEAELGWQGADAGGMMAFRANTTS